MALMKNVQDAALAVDEMFASALQNAGSRLPFSPHLFARS
jgi:hypothetical protein